MKLIRQDLHGLRASGRTSRMVLEIVGWVVKRDNHAVILASTDLIARSIRGQVVRLLPHEYKNRVFTAFLGENVECKFRGFHEQFKVFVDHAVLDDAIASLLARITAPFGIIAAGDDIRIY